MTGGFRAHAAQPQMHMWRAPDGAELVARRWSAAGRPRAGVALVHGYAEHAGRYARFAAALVDAGFDVHALDLRGHGRSPGVRGDVVQASITADVRAFAAELEAPRFLFGHSVGASAAALAAVELDDVTGLVLSSPYLVNAVPVPALIERLGRVVARGFPHLPVQRFDPAGLASTPGVMQAYLDDPLVYSGWVRAGAGVAMLSMGAAALAAAPRIRTSTLVIHGSADRIADPAGARAFIQAVGSADARLELYAGGFHELLNDLERERVTADVVAWLQARAPS